MELILDIGSGRSLNDKHRAMAMIGAVADMDSHKHKIVFKAQLFKEAPPNIPLDLKVYGDLYYYAKKLGYEMTASVFDMPSLQWLLCYKPTFVKIACRPDLYWLIGEIPRKVPVYVSYDSEDNHDIAHGKWDHFNDVQYLACVRQYPAEISQYDSLIEVMGYEYEYERGLSDHTVGWDLLRKYNPRILEKHLCPERDPDNPDSGPFAVTPEELKEIM